MSFCVLARLLRNIARFERSYGYTSDNEYFLINRMYLCNAIVKIHGYDKIFVYQNYFFCLFQMSEDVRTMKALLKEADISADDSVVHTLLDYQYCKFIRKIIL